MNLKTPVAPNSQTRLNDTTKQGIIDGQLPYSGTEVYEVPPFKGGFEEAKEKLLSQPMRIKNEDGLLEEVYPSEEPLIETSQEGLRSRIWRFMTSVSNMWGKERNLANKRGLSANVIGALFLSKTSRLKLPGK